METILKHLLHLHMYSFALSSVVISCPLLEPPELGTAHSIFPSNVNGSLKLQPFNLPSSPQP